ncbi:MAG: SCP2 sterol-binding domain-containing protein, partial [Alphaproteobacteria bacterium]
MSMESATRALEARLNEFAGLGARVKFDFGADGVLLVDAAATTPSLSQDGGDAECTITLTVDDLEKLIAGALSPTLAYMTGKLKVAGSMGVAMK